jgi:hypothetical protein
MVIDKGIFKGAFFPLCSRLWRLDFALIHPRDILCPSNAINENAQIVDFETAVKQCDGISAEDFLTMWVQDIKELGEENGYACRGHL